MVVPRLCLEASLPRSTLLESRGGRALVLEVASTPHTQPTGAWTAMGQPHMEPELELDSYTARQLGSLTAKQPEYAVVGERALTKVPLAVPLAVPLVVSGVSYFSSSLRRFRRFLWPEAISQRVFISRGRTRAHWKALVKAHTIVQ